MFVSLQPFVYSVFNSFRNDRKITVFQVEEQFLERASYLYPRVVPAHDAVDAFFVRYIFNDVAGMFQRKLRFVTLHGENAAVAFGQRMDGTGKVGGIRRCSQVVNHVACGHNAQSGVEQYGGMENGFVKSLPVFAMTPAHIDEVAPELAFFDELFELLHIEGVVQKGIELVPLVYDTFPACPPQIEKVVAKK